MLSYEASSKPFWGVSVEELALWFEPLNAALGAGAQPAEVSPGPAEASLLLKMGKLAAEAGPQRMYALLTAFAVGRALGRCERDDPSLDPVVFLQAALGHVQAVAQAAGASPAP
ncbi:MAG: hypothetical protein NVSMB32_09390 [Actinomycetota bacterium]